MPNWWITWLKWNPSLFLFCLCISFLSVYFLFCLFISFLSLYFFFVFVFLFCLCISFLSLYLYFVKQTHQLVIQLARAPLIDQEFPFWFWLRAGEGRRDSLTILIQRRRRAVSLIKGAARILRSSRLFGTCQADIKGKKVQKQTNKQLQMLENNCSWVSTVQATFSNLTLLQNLVWMFLQDVSPSLCKGPPLARAYNYVKFIERGGGEGGKRGGRGTFWLKQDLSEMLMRNSTPLLHRK